MTAKTQNSGPESTKPYGAIFGGLLLFLFLIVAIFGGLKGPSIPDGAVVAIDGIDNGEISQEELDQGIVRSAKELGIEGDAPQPGDPQYDSIREQVLSNLIISKWVEGEAAEKNITADAAAIDEQLAQIKKQSFNDSDKQFAKFAEDQGFCSEEELKDGSPEQCAGIRSQVELSILRDSLQQDVVENTPTVSDGDVQDFYDANIESFQVPANRDLRVILNKDRAKVVEAAALIAEDDSDDNWDKVAKEFSTDAASKDRGGLLQGVTPGQFGDDFDERAFSLEEGAVSKPFNTERGFYVIQADQITDESTRPLSEAAPEIQQQLAAAAQEAAGTNFQNDFIEKWSSRTECADDVAIDQLCDNAKPAEIDEEAIIAAGDGQFPPPAVISSRPIAPGTATFAGPSSTPQQGLPQGPISPAAEAPAIDPAALQQIPPTGAPQGATGAP